MPRKFIPDNKVDRDDLHALVYERANSRGRVLISHRELAETLGIRADHLGRIFSEMCTAKRMKKLFSSTEGVTYTVREPREWARETGYHRPRRH